MELDVITNLLSSVAFPMLMCLILIKYIQDIQTQRAEEVKNMTEALNNNTLAIHTMCLNCNSVKKEVTK